MTPPALVTYLLRIGWKLVRGPGLIFGEIGLFRRWNTDQRFDRFLQLRGINVLQLLAQLFV